ncbi:DR2241 family protein [Haladaptatus caseinilyticus]|uniref:DR2241 family protein n=1 Tax=Haladaptatus caseinilyticus TaxID=2993314 RepID=UPI00224A8254|nr:DR2241 family protein [Haladaptatus caseinilyticus]
MDSDGERVKSDPATGTASQPNRSAVAHCTRIDELVRSASDGIDFDGLSVEHDERFTFETRSTRHKGLTESAFRTAARDHPRYVSNWYHWEHEVGGHGTHRREFLRWLEGARRPVSERYDALQTETGFSRTWGELALSVRLTEGFEREYTVRHIEDRDEDASALHTPDDPSAIRDLSRSTDDGTYRPLRTAPTLPTGWSFETNDPDDLYRVVEWVYPATVANWNEERSGNLDVTHFEETADRQTGIYAEIGALDGDALENAVVACCADSVCCKRREWDATDAEDIAVPRGDGEFPCREPCSLFVAAAREFLAVEREDADDGSRFERATERGTDGKQAFVDAIVVDSSVRDGELSDSGNRYRVRYRHAKQFEEVR